VRKFTNYKIVATTSDNASPMVKARRDIAKKYNILEFGCQFHSTDSAGGAIINALPWLKESVANAQSMARFVKKRARPLAIFGDLMRLENERRYKAARGVALAADEAGRGSEPHDLDA
jgi:hypothetical protein